MLYAGLEKEWRNSYEIEEIGKAILGSDVVQPIAYNTHLFDLGEQKRAMASMGSCVCVEGSKL